MEVRARARARARGKVGGQGGEVGRVPDDELLDGGRVAILVGDLKRLLVLQRQDDPVEREPEEVVAPPVRASVRMRARVGVRVRVRARGQSWVSG